ncbi:aluminum-activated malate transporter 14-like [Senna tora]|uniref:Aluminum-activated malate transporter 14-like n=1 Tax=Senna tora TaxID=362788 RepID=A0A834T4L0_9FABA|nr:aluminum-activated malate transporter 14-like [Senna tora]
MSHLREKKIHCSVVPIGSYLRDKKKSDENDTRKVIHSIKVGFSLVLVSLLYLLDPLYDQAGDNAMWAIMIVLVIFEFYAGLVKIVFSEESIRSTVYCEEQRMSMSDGSSCTRPQVSYGSSRIRCHCGEDAAFRTSSRVLTYGRRFFNCPKMQGQQCSFFEWFDKQPTYERGREIGQKVQVKISKLEEEIRVLKLNQDHLRKEASTYLSSRSTHALFLFFDEDEEASGPCSGLISVK